MPRVEPTVAHSPGRAAWWQSPWLPALVGALCFANSLSNGFAYDDVAIVEENPRIRTLANPAQIWLSDWWQPQDEEQAVADRYRDRLYRPLAMFTFAVDFAIAGLQPWFFHLTNVLLHAACCVLLWWLGLRLFDDRLVATLGALLFAVHPVHAEAVANVVGRAEVLAALFLLGGSLLLLPRGGRPGVGRTLLAAACFLLALFGKETAICYVPVGLLLMHWCYRGLTPRVDWRWWLTRLGLLLLPLLVYFPMRYVALDSHLLRDRPPDPLVNPLMIAEVDQRIHGALTVLGHYARLLFAPAKLSCDYGVAVVDPDRGPGLLTLVGIVAATAWLIGLWGYVRKGEAWQRVALLTAVGAASYVLISNTVLLIGVAVAERLFYWPSAPLLLLAAVLAAAVWRQSVSEAHPLHRSRQLLALLGLALVVGLAARTVIRSGDWASNRTLFFTDVQTYPESAVLNESVATLFLYDAVQREDLDAAQRRQFLERADSHLAKTLKLHPRFPNAMRKRGRVYAVLSVETGDKARAQRYREKAIRYFEAALQLNPRDQISKRLLAEVRGARREVEGEIAKLKQQLTTQPANAALRAALGRAYLDAGRHLPAQEQLEEAARLSPDDVEVLRSLANVLLVNNEKDRAIAALRRVVAQAPTDWQSRVNLSVMLTEQDPAAALELARQAHRLQPEALETNGNLAEALVANGQVTEALRIYRLIERSLGPEDPMRASVRDRIAELEQGRE